MKDQKPEEHFAADREVSLVFFSYPAQPSVAFERVERKGNTVQIRYALVSHGELSIATGLAIIPLNKLASGTYRVEMIRSPQSKLDPPGYPPVPTKLEQSIVCQNFGFIVDDKK